MSLGLFVQIGNILSGRYGKDKEIEIEISVVRPAKGN